MNIGSCISRLERRPKAGGEDGLIGRRGWLVVIGLALGIAVAAAPAPMVRSSGPGPRSS
jgi:hypothetical protein